MLKYAAIVPHSPLLFDLEKNQATLAKKLAKTFAVIAADLKKQGIKHCLSIAPHSLFDRASFSVYTNEKYTIAFPEFADLVTTKEVSVWWELFHSLRQQSKRFIIEPQESDYLDYGHGLPLLRLLQHFVDDQTPSLLCLNDYPPASDAERFALGQWLRSILDQFTEPCAVLCSGDLFITNNNDLSDKVGQKNKIIKDTLPYTVIEEKSFSTDIVPPCLKNPLKILNGIMADTPYAYEELAFSMVPQTSFLLARLQ